MVTGDLALLHDWFAAAHRDVDHFEDETINTARLAIKAGNSAGIKLDQTMRDLGAIAARVTRDLPTMASARAA